MTATADQETMPLGDTPAPEPSRLDMKVPRHAAIVRRALENEQDLLRKLAEKVDDSGYPREARIVKGDSETIAEDLLPQLSEQGELALATAEEVRFGIINRIRRSVKPYMREARPEEPDPLGECLQAIAAKVELFAAAVAERAYRAGFEARQHEPEALALASLDAMGDAE